jgi:cell division septation protein DedD
MEPALKQRLVGAAVLIALAVIFLPMLIQGPAPESGIADVPLDAPRAPQGDFETRDLPLVAPESAPADGALGMEATPAQAATVQAQNPDAADLAMAATTAVPAPAATVVSAPLQEPKVATAPLPGAEKKPAPAEIFPAPTAGGDFAVNVGSYSTVASADKLVASLRASGLAAYREAATANGKAVQRVRLGPFATRAQAENARLKATHVRDDIRTTVVALDAEQLPAAQPAAAKTATATVAAKPAAAGSGFAVQLAAFSKPADANALRDKLRGAGFSAFTEVVNTDKGSLTRVRVGPVLNRAEADQLKAQVKSKVGLDGIVRPHP